MRIHWSSPWSNRWSAHEMTIPQRPSSQFGRAEGGSPEPCSPSLFVLLPLPGTPPSRGDPRSPGNGRCASSSNQRVFLAISEEAPEGSPLGRKTYGRVGSRIGGRIGSRIGGRPMRRPCWRGQRPRWEGGHPRRIDSQTRVRTRTKRARASARFLFSWRLTEPTRCSR